MLLRRRQELGTPRAPPRVTAWMSATRILRKLLTRSGSGGVSSVTVGLSSVGPPPTSMMIQLLASATYGATFSRKGAAWSSLLLVVRPFSSLIHARRTLPV